MKMVRKSVVASAVLLMTGVGFAQYPPPTTSQTKSGSPAAAPAPPAYTPVRWNENYGYLKDPARRTDLFDPIKYIPLGPDGWYLSLGAQARYRYEYFDENNFGAGPQDDDGFHLFRLMGHADLHLGANVRVFVQGISAFEEDREGGPRPVDEDDLDLHQGFVDLNFNVDDVGVTLRGGRQNLLYGAQRLISPLDWTNVRRTFDGGRAMIASPDNQLDVFVVKPVIVEVESFNDTDDDSLFAGVYDVISLPNVGGKAAGTKLDLYFLYLERDTTATVLTESDTYTVGARLWTNPKPWDLDVEADYQFGDFGDGDISAWSFAVEGGYTFADAALSPRLFLGFDIASGDDDPSDSDLERFNQLFPLGHAYFGYIDVVGRQNIIDVHPGVSLKVSKDVTFRADYHLFWRESDNDALYAASGAPLIPAGGSDETYVGSELDLLVNWQIDRHLLAYFGYSHFFAGDFVDESGAATGADEDIDFAYAALVFTF